MKEKLKPCPFCGEKEEISQGRYQDGHWNAYCLMCGASGPNKQTEAESFKAWNRRPKK